MKLLFTYALLVLNSFVLFGQDQQLLTVTEDSSQIQLTQVDIDVTIIGTIATTITKLTFYNPHDRILEGELNFPLSENQSVHRFAMDVNGSMREGVVVDKNQGTVAFEGVVRQTIDPGLLEQTYGNNYKARVYPIPATGNKTILIGYEEELQSSNIYQLIADYGHVSEFNLSVKVIDLSAKPVVKESTLGMLSFDRMPNAYIGSLSIADLDVNGQLIIDLPGNKNDQVFREQGEGDDIFYINVPLDVPAKEKPLPNSICVLWDVSYSAENREIPKELEFLKKYIAKVSDLEVRLILFSNDTVEDLHYRINDGTSDELIEVLRKAPFDGGTSFAAINLQEIKEDEIFLFTDGLFNLDSFESFRINLPIHFISSSNSVDYKIGRYVSSQTGGEFINLNVSSISEALNTLSSLQYSFLGIEGENGIVHSVYPKNPQTAGSRFSLAGLLNSNIAETIKIKFGTGKTVSDTYTIQIPSASGQEQNLERLWAKKKISALLENPNHESSHIATIAKTYNIVTPYTSLIVLDRIEDYVEYEIVPPKELQEEYYELLKEKTSDVSLSEEEILEDLLNEYEERIEWWSGEFKTSSTKDTLTDPIDSNAEEDSLSIDSESNQEEISRARNRDASLEQEIDQISSVVEDENSQQDLASQIIVSGNIVDEDGEPLVGASIVINGTSIGTISDLDGAYSISVGPKDTLQVSYLGYDNITYPVDDSSEINLRMSSSLELLEEVVVTGYAAAVTKSNLTSSISTVLQGRATGLAGSSNEYSIRVRGFSATNTEGPMVILDGALVSTETLELLDPNNIESISVVKDENLSAIYGAAAQNGLIIVTSKEATVHSLQLQDSIVALIDDIELEEWNPSESYLDSIEHSAPKDRYKTYLQLRKSYRSSPSFYIVVGNYFIQNGDIDLGLRIMSNIAELQLENHELLKTLAYAYQQEGEYEKSIPILKKVVDLRPHELHSKRDLALALQSNDQAQESLDLFHEILLSEDYNDEADRFPLFKTIVMTEMNNVISQNPDLDVSQIDTGLMKHLPVDIRVVLDWNNLETDLDLWIEEPNQEVSSYENMVTNNGGFLTEDYVDGYGPEEYSIKEAVKGEYKIIVDFYDDRVQKISGPVILQITIYKNYGSGNQELTKITRALSEEKDEIEIGSFVWR